MVSDISAETLTPKIYRKFLIITPISSKWKNRIVYKIECFLDFDIVTIFLVLETFFGNHNVRFHFNRSEKHFANCFEFWNWKAWERWNFSFINIFYDVGLIYQNIALKCFSLLGWDRTLKDIYLSVVKQWQLFRNAFKILSWLSLFKLFKLIERTFHKS